MFFSNCIIDKNVSIGDDVRIVGGDHLPDGDHKYHYVRDGIVIVPKEKQCLMEFLLGKNKKTPSILIEAF